MRRPFATINCVLAAVFVPALCLAQAATTGSPSAQPPAGAQPPAQQPAPPAGTTATPPAGQTGAPATGTAAAPATPAPLKLAFTTPAGLLLVQIKSDQTAVFEEMITKLKAGLAKTQDAALKQQTTGLKVYKATEPFNQNVLYVVTMDPAAPASEYELFSMMQKTMTTDELRAPETIENWKRYQAAFATGLSKLSLTPVGG